MKKTLLAFIIFTLTIPLLYSQTKQIRLLVRGDDMGFSHSGNEALIKCYKEGIEQSIEVLVLSPWFPEAVKMLEENTGVDVGIHLALTSEWDNVKWRPLTDCPSLEDTNGYFYPMIWANKNYPARNLLSHEWKLSEIEKEWRAQIETGIKNIPRVSHLSGHMGCMNMNDSVHALAKQLAKEYHLFMDGSIPAIRYLSYEGPHKTSEEKIATFIKMLNKLSADTTYVFLEHPGLNTPELQAIHHIGYEDVADDRQGVTDMFTDENVKATIRKKGIKLISYKDL